eukprot:COSAG02_NODE_384_length_23406_cov_9.459733_13_plen_67_part_00
MRTPNSRVSYACLRRYGTLCTPAARAATRVACAPLGEAAVRRAPASAGYVEVAIALSSLRRVCSLN